MQRFFINHSSALRFVLEFTMIKKRVLGSKAWVLGQNNGAFSNCNRSHQRHSANGLMRLALSPLETTFAGKDIMSTCYVLR